MVSYSNRECRLALLTAGANVNCKLKNGEFPLLVASDTDTLQLLLDHGADVNMTNDRGETALMAAAFNGLHKIVKLLLQAGADVNSTDESGNTALLVAVSDGNRKDIWKSDCESILHEEAGDGALLKAEADIKIDNKDFENYPECVEALLEAGADVNIKNKTGITALSYAAHEGATAFITALLKAGADVNLNNLDGSTALTRATAQGHSDIVKVLLDAGAEVNLDTATAAIYCRDQRTFQLVYNARYGKSAIDDLEAGATGHRMNV